VVVIEDVEIDGVCVDIWWRGYIRGWSMYILFYILYIYVYIYMYVFN
jgi:hypothetical protein